MWLQVLTLLYGVYDNSPILSHTMHHLACNTEIQRTEQAEVDAVWGSHPPKAMEQLISLRYVTACLKVSGNASAWRTPVRLCLPTHLSQRCVHAFPSPLCMEGFCLCGSQTLPYR